MAIRIDASGDVLKRTANLPDSAAFTACGWAIRQGDTNNYTTIFSLSNSSGGGIYLETDSDGESLKVYSDGDFTFSSLLATLVTGTPFFWAIVGSGTGAGGVSAYYATQGAGSLTSVSHIGFSMTEAEMYFGNDFFAEWFNGSLMAVKVWDAAFTANELLQEMQTIRPQRFANLHLWIPGIDNAAGNAAIDYSGNGRSLTTAGTLTTEQGAGVRWGAAPMVMPSAAASADTTLAASGSAQAGGAGGLDTDIALAAIGVSVAGGEAGLVTSIPLLAVGFAVTSGAAGFATSVRLDALGLAQAAGAAGLSTQTLLAGAGAAQAAGNAPLATQIRLAASGAALAAGNTALASQILMAASGGDQAGGSADLAGGASNLAASGGAQAGGSAVLTVSIRLAASGAALAAGAAQLSSAVALAAAGTDTASGVAQLSTTITLTAEGFAQAMAAGALVTVIPLSAFGNAQATGLATLTEQTQPSIVAYGARRLSRGLPEKHRIIVSVSTRARNTERRRK